MLNKKDDNDEKLKYINKLNGNKKNYDYINNKIINTRKKIEEKKEKIKELNKALIFLDKIKIKDVNLLKSEYEKEIKDFKKNLLDKRDKSEEKYPDMPYLETEGETAENIADIYERRYNTREKE